MYFFNDFLVTFLRLQVAASNIFPESSIGEFSLMSDLMLNHFLSSTF